MMTMPGETMMSDAPQRRPINELLAEYRRILDARDDLNARLKGLGEQQRAVEARLREFHETTGLTSAGDGSITISFDPHARRVVIDPAKWEDFKHWAVESGYGFILYRQVSQGKLMELLDHGVAPPEGVSVETYLDMSFRRK